MEPDVKEVVLASVRLERIDNGVEELKDRVDRLLLVAESFDKREQARFESELRQQEAVQQDRLEGKKWLRDLPNNPGVVKLLYLLVGAAGGGGVGGMVAAMTGSDAFAAAIGTLFDTIASTP